MCKLNVRPTAHIKTGHESWLAPAAPWHSEPRGGGALEQIFAGTPDINTRQHARGGNGTKIIYFLFLLNWESLATSSRPAPLTAPIDKQTMVAVALCENSIVYPETMSRGGCPNLETQWPGRWLTTDSCWGPSPVQWTGPRDRLLVQDPSVHLLVAEEDFLLLLISALWSWSPQQSQSGGRRYGASNYTPNTHNTGQGKKSRILPGWWVPWPQSKHYYTFPTGHM